jgi:DNA helicase-2/ATP-dependent DNA helicase PcrA
MSEFTPRLHQKEILSYKKGYMGIAAVPGSGKTWTLSRLAANLIKDHRLISGQEILIVTLTNSAVDNFTSRINDFLSEGRSPLLIPPYRVRTLHGLAHDIVRERPDLVGLDPSFNIIDERTSAQIRNDVTSAWIKSKPYFMDEYISPTVSENQLDWVHRKHMVNLLQSVSEAFIKTAKNQMKAPSDLQSKLDHLPVPLPLAEMGTEIYFRYQRALAYQGGVDFNDLIWLAYRILESDNDFLVRLQNRWPYILEDEAQDSSDLQEKILRLLVGSSGNWVRVGDPNQAIFETFTTANPQFLRDFINECGNSQELPVSGRSTKSIIDLANHLIDWTRKFHPIKGVRNALDVPFIEPTSPDDPQPNPKDYPDGIKLVIDKFNPNEEIDFVVRSIAGWIPSHSDRTIAVLVPRNQRGIDLANQLKNAGIPYDESLLKSTTSTRKTSGALYHLLSYLSEPGSSRKLAKAYSVWRRRDLGNPELQQNVNVIGGLIEKCSRVEDFIWPRPGRDWVESVEDAFENPDTTTSLVEFRDHVRLWQGSVLLPINQIILTLSQDIFEEAHELALSYKLAQLLRQASNSNPQWGLSELAGELRVIANNERGFIGFSEDDTGFNPEKYKGKVVISTMHKAKGLEWDRVYLMSVNSYNFPSGKLTDSYFPEKWFIRESQNTDNNQISPFRLNLEAETLNQFETLVNPDIFDFYQEGQATLTSRLDYIRERLRLFYVGITRAKIELIITSNTGKNGNSEITVPMLELANFWEDYLEGFRDE